MKKSLYLIVLLLAALVQGAVSADYIFDRGVVVAKVIGSCEPTPETTKPHDKGTEEYFWTSIEITETRNGFLQDFKGQKLKILTGSFDKNLLGKSLPLQLIARKKDKSSKPELLFECTELRTSYIFGKANEEQSQRPKTAN